MAVLNHNRPKAYRVSAVYFERLPNQLEDQLEDLEDAKLVQERANDPFIDTSPHA